MTLTELNGFEYSHSEELGNAFEYLLQCMGTQGENGQFRTPRHIIDFMVRCLDPQPGDRILDPACGTGGFLVSAYRHILAKHSSGNGQGDGRDGLNGRHGPGNSSSIKSMPSISSIPGDLLTHIYDTLSNDARWHEKADLILANPPFMTPKGASLRTRSSALPRRRPRCSSPTTSPSISRRTAEAA